MKIKKNIAVFASGGGSNAEKIFAHFQDDSDIDVSLLLSNKPDAFVLKRAEKFSVPTHVFSRDDFFETTDVLATLQKHRIDWIVLAGFLWLIPANLIKAFPQKIVNIHPALLPKYGGKGMYGINVHRAVVAAREKESGMTIHYVNEQYDEGNIIFQGRCELDENDDPEEVARKVLTLEHQHYARIVRDVITNRTG